MADPDPHPERISIDATGTEEVAVLPWPLLFRDRVAARIRGGEPSRAWTLFAVLTGIFSVGVTITILSVSLPRIADDLDSSTATLTWLITGPLLAFGAVGPAIGKSADVWGHRRVFLLGLAGTGFFAALTALAWNATSLIAFRVLGAALGAATGPSSMAMLVRAFPVEERVKAMGYWSLVGAGAPVIGVVAGGPIVEHVSWRMIFVAQVPFTVAAILLGLAVIPRDRPTGAEREPVDRLGTITLSAGVTALLVALNRGPVLGWSHGVVVGGFVLAPVLLSAFVAVERRAVAPIVPLEWLRRRNFTFPLVVQFFLNFTYMGSFIITPLFLKEAFGYGETRTGLLSIARPLTFSVTSPIAGWITVRLGERRVAVAGSAAVVASMGLWQLVDPGGGDWRILLALAVAGVGMGMASPAMAASVANAVDERSLGIVGAAQQLVAQVGVVAGIQLAQTVQSLRESGAGVVGSFHEAYLVLGLASAMAIAGAAFVEPARR